MTLLKSLFENAGLPTDFEEKASTLFEAAVEEKVKEQLNTLQESFDAKLAASKEEFVAEAVELLDKTVQEAIVEWSTENAEAIDTSIKGTIAESFLSGLRGLFEHAEVEIKGDAEGKIKALQEQVESLTKSVEDTKAALTEAQETIVSAKIKSIVESVTVGLSDTEALRVSRLVEAFDFKSEEDFRAKVELVKEAVTGGASSAPHSAGDGRPGSAVAADPKKNEFNAPNSGEGSGNTNHPTETKKQKDGTPASSVKVEAGIKGTVDADGVIIPVKEGETSTDEEKASLKEQYEQIKANNAPHLDADLVAATLAILK